MPTKLKLGDRVLVEISESEIYEGTINRLSSKYLELYDIFCQTSNLVYEGNLTFYRNEVNSITVISESSKSVPSNVNNNTTSNLSNKIKMDPEEFNRLKRMTFDFIFIDSFGEKFKTAVDVLSNRESVAVVGLGNMFLRSKPLSLLVLADFKQIFIFDLYCLVELADLKDILESNYITKIVHDGVALNSCLYYKYGIEMQNIFDIKIVDSTLSKEENDTVNERNLSECLTYYFNFPASLLSAAIDDVTEKSWLERPLVKGDKVKAAQLVAYLPSLRDILMSKILKKYTETIKTEYSAQRNVNNFQLLELKNK